MKKNAGILESVENNDLNLLSENPKAFWKGIEIIKEGAFDNCTNLKVLKIPKDVYLASPFVFLNCNNLETIEVSKDFCKRYFNDICGGKNLETLIVDCEDGRRLNFSLTIFRSLLQTENNFLDNIIQNMPENIWNEFVANEDLFMKKDKSGNKFIDNVEILSFINSSSLGKYVNCVTQIDDFDEIDESRL